MHASHVEGSRIGMLTAKRKRNEESAMAESLKGKSESFLNNLPMVDPMTIVRGYQLEIFNRAKEKNTISYLDTGTGKTLIAVMLVKHYAHQIRKPQNQYAVFLAPTVVLVQQQADTLEMFTDLKIGRYWGDMCVDSWDEQRWEEELNTYEVFVMTPQIFLDNLRHCFFHFDAFRLIIFDECHHARKNHPYAVIMREFYHRNISNRTGSARIFGMTCVPVYSKGTSPLHCAKEITVLEQILDSKVYTPEDMTELLSLIVYPEIKILYYDVKGIPLILKGRLSAQLDVVRDKHTKFEGNGRDGERMDKLRKKIQKLNFDILYCAEEMGMYCAAIACDVLQNTKAEGFACTANDDILVDARRHFLADAFHVCQQLLPRAKNEFWCYGNDIVEDGEAGFISSKVKCLIESLFSYRDLKALRCIVFVQRVIASRVIAKLLGTLKCFKNLIIENMVGCSSTLQDKSEKDRKKLINAFRDGKVNIIVATQVLEEGLDVQSCNLVLRYDLPKTICSFIQSRGRARMKGSHYVLLVQRDNEENKKLEELLAGEQFMREAASHQVLDKSQQGLDVMLEEEYYCVEKTGAIVTLNSSIPLIYYYCSQLPGDRYFKPLPIFQINKEDGVCILEMPANCPISEKITVQAHAFPKNKACLEACKMLHALGALKDNLLPERRKEDIDVDGNDDDRHLHNGGSDSERAYPLYIPKSLVADWRVDAASALFHCYSLSLKQDFSSDVPFRRILLLTRDSLDPLVCEMQMCLELSEGHVNLQVQSAGIKELTTIEVQRALQFQVKIYNLLLKQSIEVGSLESLCESELGRKHVMYLLLPQVPDDNSESSGISDTTIDWMCVTNLSCGRMHKHCTFEKRNQLHTAEGVFPINLMHDLIVETPHNKRIYHVETILKHLNASSCMLREQGSTTYIDYFRKKYGIDIEYREQSLFCARHLENVKNYLLRQTEAEKASVSTYYVELPPELCKIVYFGISRSVLYTYSFLPSIMHYIEGITGASQLQNLFPLPGNVRIPASKVLEALTMKKCSERISLERLETLGDSFLKYASSQYLFMLHSKEDEGKLTRKRKQLISNKSLYKIGCERLIPGFIRSEKFDPTHWIIPGNHLFSSSGDVHSEIKSSQEMYVKKYRLLSFKTIADAVEALIGAFLEEGGETASINFMKCLGIIFDTSTEAPCIKHSALTVQNNVNVHRLQSLLNYSFCNPGLLVEALTHASYRRAALNMCYQRLEFLGDAIMDYCITLHLYKSHTALAPGMLTDLRAAAVNNDCYGQAAAKHNLQQYLLHASQMMYTEIRHFIKYIHSSHTSAYYTHGWTKADVTVPKVLGDIIESIAGAIFIDSGFQVKTVWDVMRPLLEPLVTPETLEYHPVRELHEICAKNAFELHVQSYWTGNTCYAEIEICEGADMLCSERRKGPNKKAAKRVAAQKVVQNLKDLLASRNSIV